LVSAWLEKSVVRGSQFQHACLEIKKSVVVKKMSVLAWLEWVVVKLLKGSREEEEDDDGELDVKRSPINISSRLDIKFIVKVGLLLNLIVKLPFIVVFSYIIVELYK
jgi:hypothetical protein